MQRKRKPNAPVVEAKLASLSGVSLLLELQVDEYAALHIRPDEDAEQLLALFSTEDPVNHSCTRQWPTERTVHSSMGRNTVGVGRSMCSSASPIYEHSRVNCARSKKRSLEVSRYAAVRKSCVAAMRISPFFGVHRF